MLRYPRPEVSFYLLFLIFLCPNILSQRCIQPVPAADNISNYLSLLQHKRVAIMANQTSLVHQTHLVDTLLKLKIKVIKIFGPEHGFRGNEEAGAFIKTGKDLKTGIKVISLYGKKTKPTATDLKGIDVVLFDIQDVGVRFYTYISSLAMVMEACAESSIPIIVLDRPNPNGYYVDGPVLKPEFHSFVGMFPIPVVYGLTIGELATMINGEGWLANHIQCSLKVIKCEGYNHRSHYKLPVAPSPNLQTERAVILYPSLAFFEGTSISVGRGTDFPFEVFGHPQMRNCSFTFTPHDIPQVSVNPLQNGKTCFGIDLRNSNLDSIIQLGKLSLDWLNFAYKNISVQDSFFNSYFYLLAGNKELKQQIFNGIPESKIRETWKDELLQFRTIRKKYLLYPDFE
jgi:uncharacterized protein YbbC (DUF1343 family)